jgi:uncharacterized RDD family membrane protein YckC
MSYIEKYTVSKRGQEVGPYTATEVIDLLRMKELSTIHKVKIGKDWILISDFLDRFEKGDLPEQNLEKTFEDAEGEVQEAEPEAEVPVEEPVPEPEPEPEPIEVPQPGAATEIHVNRSGTQFGPYLFKELKDYLKAGNLRFSDMVWFEGVSEWVPLSRIPGVAEGIDSLGSAAPPPPKPPPAPAAPAAPPLMQQAAPSKPAEEAFEDQDAEPEEVEGSEDSGEEEANPLSRGLASHGARVLAALVDGLIIFGVLGFLIGIVGLMTGVWDVSLLISFFIGYFVLGWLYFGLTESSKSGGGVGKKMTKIKVVKSLDGSTPGFALVSMRSLLKILFSLTFLLPFVALLTPRRQGLHDLACGTIVRSGKEVGAEQDLTQ